MVSGICRIITIDVHDEDQKMRTKFVRIYQIPENTGGGTTLLLLPIRFSIGVLTARKEWTRMYGKNTFGILQIGAVMMYVVDTIFFRSFEYGWYVVQQLAWSCVWEIEDSPLYDWMRGA
jgi:hypothetical protein